jgi:acyl transferase domain-containing protein/acyl carrier protein
MAEGTLILSGGEHDARPVERRFDSELLRNRRAVVADDGARRLVSSGRPTPDHRIAIVDPEKLARCPDAIIGEIWVSGPSIAAGYWGNPELSHQTFLAATADGDPGPFLRTGDLGFFLDGELFVVGRLKDLIIVRGRNLHPEDIELSVSHCDPDVRPGGGAAFAIEHEGEERLVMVQEVARHPRGSHDEIITAIRRAVAADHGVEVHAIALLQSSSAPKTSSGKIQRYLCREGFLAGELREVARWTQAERSSQPEDEVVAIGEAAQVEQVAAGTPNAKSPDRERIEQWLVARVARTAGAAATSISVDEPLAHFGLGSRDVVGLTGDLEQWLGRRLSPVLAYRYPTIKALAVHLAAGSVEVGGVHRVRATASETEPIAIVGLSCRFPGAGDPEAFWGLLANAVDAVSERPERWSSNGAVAPDLTQMTTMAGGFLDEVDAFDADFFGISPREAVHMDPQQRLLLEVAWEALERAGALGPTASNGRTGVFMGVSTNDYAQLMVRGGATIDAYVGTGTAPSIAANRLSYQLDLRGPSLAVDTACSSSLVAVHLAVSSLRRGECDAALAGGVNLLLSPDPSLAFSHARMMAQRGRCRTFDAGADGYVRGEGCGVLVLKRLSDALQNQDHVVALIRGSAMNQDGRSNGLTAPNGLAQQAVIREALSDAGLSAGDIDYIEAHGTGTPLGDPIEVEAIKEVLLQDRPVGRPCALGSVKTNIGHLEAAAGIAGMIKAALAIERGQIPAHLHLERLNPAISLEGTPLFVAQNSVPWPSTTAPRRAGVSSFGFGGTNCHVILEQAPAIEPRPDAPERPRHLLSLSAKTGEALAALAGKFAGALQRGQQASLEDVCFTANAGRTHHDFRLASSASSLEELAGTLSAFAAGESPAGLEAGRVDRRDSTRVAFLFTGQGSQYPGMGRELYETEPRFRRELVRCEAILRDHLQEPLLSVMYGDRHDLLNETAYTQAAVFALEWSLVELWRSWGVEPRGVIGHSVGEYLAACVAGVFGLEDALTLVAARGRLMQALPRNGAMAALRCREDVALAALERFASEASIAAVNGPEDVVVSGRRQVVERVCAELAARGVSAQLLNVSHAFHSPLMEPMLDEFEALAQRLTYRSPSLELISNVTGKRAGEDVRLASYWRRHVRQGVRFWEGLQTLRSEGYSKFLELGPAPVLTALGRRQAVDGETWAWSLRRNRGDWSQMLESLGCLYVKGASVNWTGFDVGRNRRRVALPTYAFERRRFWFKPGAVKRVDIGAPAHGQDGDVRDWLYELEWLPSEPQGVREMLAGTWLLLGDVSGVAEHLAKRLERAGHACVVLRADEILPAVGKAGDDVTGSALRRALDRLPKAEISRLRGVVHLWSLDATPPEQTTATTVSSDQDLGARSAVQLIQAFATARGRPPLIWFVTRGAQAVVGRAAPIAFTQAPLWAIGRTCAAEHPSLWGGLVDLDPDATTEDCAADLLRTLSSSDREDQVAFARGQRHVARIGRVTSKERTSVRVEPDASYLITGGLDGVGLEVARWLVGRGARHLVLVGRTRLPDREAWTSGGHGEPVRRRVAAIQALEGAGAHVEFPAVDVSSEEQMTLLFERLGKTGRRVAGVFHAASVWRRPDGRGLVGLLATTTASSFDVVLPPKVVGSLLLRELCRKSAPDFVVFFSSGAALVGSAGQGSYAAANAFMDALAHDLSARTGVRALSVNWGPIADAGFGATEEGRALFDRWRRRGVMAISCSQMFEALEQLLSGGHVQAGVMRTDWSMLQASYAELLDAPWATRLVGAGRQRPRVDLARVVADAPPRERSELLAAHIQDQVVSVMGFDPADAPELDQGLFDMGMDSLMALELRNRLQVSLMRDVPAAALFEHSTIASLTHYILHELLELSASEISNTTGPEKTDVLAEIAELSEAEVERLLAERMAGGAS